MQALELKRIPEDLKVLFSNVSLSSFSFELLKLVFVDGLPTFGIIKVAEELFRALL